MVVSPPPVLLGSKVKVREAPVPATETVPRLGTDVSAVVVMSFTGVSMSLTVKLIVSRVFWGVLALLSPLITGPSSTGLTVILKVV